MFVSSDVTCPQAVIGCGSCGSYDGRLRLEVTLTLIGQPSLGDLLDPAPVVLSTLTLFPSKHRSQLEMAKRKRPTIPPTTTSSAKEARDDRASRRAAAQDRLLYAESVRLQAICDQARRDQM